MIMLLNPGHKKRHKSRKGRRRGCPTARAAGRAAVRRWACSTRRVRSMPANDVRRLCVGEKRGRRYARKAASVSGRSPFWVSPYATAANGRRRRHGRRRARNTNWTPEFAGNPGSIVGSATSAFNTRKLTHAVPIVGGFLGARFLSDFISAQGFMPGFLKSGVGNILVDLLGAGLANGITKMGAPSYARSVKIGGAVFVMTKIIYKYALPLVNYTPLKGLADYLTVGGAAGARPLMGMGYHEYSGLDMAGLGYNEYSGLQMAGGEDDFQHVAGGELAVS